ncbi:MAG TPA: hypothetical protein VF756_16545 [Thermoanaerobaculia bacterium]
MNVQRKSRRAPWAASLALAAAFFCAAAVSAQIRTVLVSPVPGDPGSSGANLLSALAGIPAPSFTNPWLLKIEPGIYDVKNTPLQMRPWVDIEGSGIGVTTIRGTVDPTIDLNYGTVMGADNAELRNLTVEALGNAAYSTVIPMVNSSASPRVYRVKLYGRGGTFANYGMRNITAAPLLEEVEISAIGGSYTYGIVSVATSSRRGEIRRSRITAENATNNYGLFFSTGVITKEIRDTEITARGGSSAYGVYFLNIVDALPEPISFDHVEIDILNGSANNYGIYVTSSYVPLQLFACDVQVSGAGSRYGIRQEGGPTNVLNSTVSALSGVVAATTGSVVVGNSRLLGGPVTGSSPRCLGVHDEANLFYTGACPP